MDNAARLLLLVILISVTPTMRAAAALTAAPAEGSGNSGPNAPVNHEESQTELRLLALANQSRQQAGAPPLTLDAGLSRAALIHAQTMVRERRLSHQFDGEPALPQRLAATTELHLEQEGENLALDYDAEHGHQHLMLSPPHRANLLNPAYNVIGLGVVRSGVQIYIVQDFGNALPNYSLAEVKQHIAAAVSQARRQNRQPELQRRAWPGADGTACSMAHADKLGVPSLRGVTQSSTILSYTSLHPENLPGAAARALASRDLRSFSIGACYARTETYPTGVYWLLLSLE